jgi:hypothetical protein
LYSRGTSLILPYTSLILPFTSLILPCTPPYFLVLRKTSK